MNAATITPAARDLKTFSRKGIPNALNCNSSETAGKNPIKRTATQGIRVFSRFENGMSAGAQAVGRKVKNGLIGEEEKSHRDADDVGNEERTRSDAPPRQRVAQRGKFGKVFPVNRLRGGDNQENERTDTERTQDRVEKITRNKARMGICRRVTKLTQRKRVELSEEVEARGDQSKRHGHAQRHVAVAKPSNQDHQHGQAEQDKEDFIHKLRGDVA